MSIIIQKLLLQVIFVLLLVFYLIGQIIACVASVSNRVIARKLEHKQKKVEGGGGGEKRKRLPANPTILENAP